jgi:hypothetical protein
VEITVQPRAEFRLSPSVMDVAVCGVRLARLRTRTAAHSEGARTELPSSLRHRLYGTVVEVDVFEY